MFDDRRRVSFEDLVAQGILEIGDGHRAKLQELGGDGPIFLRAGQVADTGIDWNSGERFHASDRDRLARKMGLPGDTMVTTKGNSVGRTAYVPNGSPDFVYSPHLSFWRSRDASRLAPGFLRYWAKGPEFRDQLRALAHGTDMAPYLSLVDQRRLRITLPEITEQRAISAVLGVLDDKIAANQRLVPLLRDLVKAALQRAALASTTYLVSDVADVRKGLSYTGAGLADDGMPMVNLANAVNFGWLKRSGFKYYTGPYKPRHVAQPGALLVAGVEQTWRNEIIGWPMLLPDDVGEALFSHHVFLIDFLPEHAWLRLPLWAHLYSLDARARLEGMVYGTTVATLPAEALTGLEIPAPRPDDPVLLAADGLLRRAWVAERESATLSALRQTLLPPLLSGELRVRDAESLVGEAV